MGGGENTWVTGFQWRQWRLESKLEKRNRLSSPPQIYFIRRKRNRKIMVAQIGTGGKLQFPYIMANGSAHLSYFLIFL